MVEQVDAEGFGSCSNEGECEAVCPKEIPISNIARMTREYVRAYLLRLVRAFIPDLDVVRIDRRSQLRLTDAFPPRSSSCGACRLPPGAEVLRQFEVAKTPGLPFQYRARAPVPMRGRMAKAPLNWTRTDQTERRPVSRFASVDSSTSSLPPRTPARQDVDHVARAEGPPAAHSR